MTATRITTTANKDCYNSFNINIIATKALFVVHTGKYKGWEEYRTITKWLR